MRKGKTRLGVLAGLAIGATAGILFAPQKSSLKSDHDHIDALHDALVNA